MRVPALLIACATLAASGAASAARAAGKPQPVLKGWEALTSESEARGLYDDAALEWARAALAAPDGPGAELALRRLAAIRERFAATRPLLGVLEDISRRKNASPAVRFLAKRLLVDYLRERGEWRDAEKLAATLGYVENWLAVGSFGRNIAATHDRTYAPERGIDLKAEHDPGRPCPLFRPRWRALPRRLGGEAVRPHEHLRPEGGAAYLLAQVRIDKARHNCWLFVRTRSAFKLWLNNQPSFDGDRYRRALPLEVGVRIKLRGGWNRILVKLSGPAAVSVRLADAGGNPLGLPSERKPVLHPLAPPAPIAPVVPSPPVGHLAKLDPETSASAAAARAVFARLEGMHDDAVHYAEIAARKEPRRAAWRFLLGEAYLQAAHMSSPSRNNLSAGAYRACLGLDPDFVPARIRLAGIARQEGNEEGALAELRRAASASPGCYLARLRMAEIAAGIGWRNQTRTWLAEAQKLRPDYAGCRLLEARLQREDAQLDRAIAEYRQLVKSNAADRRYRRELISALARRGLWRDAIKLARENFRVRPGDPRALAQLVRVQTASRKFVAAAQDCRRLMELVPREAAHPAELGGILLREGKRREALEAWRAALKLAPGDHALRRLVERMSGIDEDFSAAYELDIRKEIDRSRKHSYPRANAIRVLDQTVVRVYRDGSMAETIANGERAMTPRAVDSLGSQPVLGETMEIRTIRKNGEVLEPTPIPGERRMTMPGMEVGATIEYKYRVDSRPRPWGGFYLNKWYFRSPQLDEPHQVSDYIVMVPANLAHTVVRHNFDVPERVEEKNGLKVYRWTARFRSRVNAEPHMEHFDHYLPFVEVGSPRDWQDVADTFRSAYLGRTRSTRLVARTARHAVAGKQGVEAMARSLYDHVNSRVKHRGPCLNAHQVLRAGTGDREMAFLALAAAAGLEACQGRTRKAPAFQGSRDHPATWSLPSEEHFSAELVGVRLESGRLLWLDLSSRFMPFGTIREELGGARVLVVPQRGPAFFERLPAPRYDRLGPGVNLDLRLAPDGSLRGRLRSQTGDARGALARERLAGLDATGRRNYVLGLVNDAFKGARLEGLEFPGSGSPTGPFVVDARFAVDGYLLPAAEGRLTCGAGIVPLNLASTLAMDPDRKYPLKLAAPRISRESISHRLAPGLELAALPAGKVLSGDFGTYSLTVSRTAQGFRIERRALILPQRIRAKDYPRFRKFCRSVDEAERLRIVLKRVNP